MKPLPTTTEMLHRKWWSRALAYSGTGPIMSWFLFLGSYENTGLWHPCWECWEAGCKNRSSWRRNSRYAWSIPKCSDFHALEMWGVHYSRWKKLRALILTHVPFLFLPVLLKRFFTYGLFSLRCFCVHHRFRKTYPTPHCCMISSGQDAPNPS